MSAYYTFLTSSDSNMRGVFVSSTPKTEISSSNDYKRIRDYQIYLEGYNEVYVWFVPSNGYTFAEPASNATDYVYLEGRRDQSTVHADGVEPSDYSSKGLTLEWDPDFKGSSSIPMNGAFRYHARGDRDWQLGSNGYPVKITSHIRTVVESAETTYSLTYSLTHCTVSPQPETQEAASGLTLTFTPDSGYEFTDQPTATYSGGTISASDGVLTIPAGTISAGGAITVTATATEIPPSLDVSISYDLSGCRVTKPSPAPTTYTKGEHLSISVTADTGYSFNLETNPPYATYVRDGITRTISANEGDATTETIDLFIATTVNVEGNALTIVGKPTGAPTTYPVTYNVNNATVSPMLTSVTEGQTVQFTCTADSGYHFEELPTLTYSAIDGIDEVTRTITADATGILNVTFSGLTETPNITLNAYAIPESVIEDKYGIVRVYKVTSGDMKAIADFTKPAESADADPVTGTNTLTKYISTLKRFYCDVPTSETANLQLGSYSLNRTVDYVLSDIISINCGSAKIPAKYNDATDYARASVSIWLPFVGWATLDASLVMGQTISLAYKVNVLSGDCVAAISINGIAFETMTGNVSYPVPYETAGEYNIYSNLAISPLYMLSLTPYAIVTENLELTSQYISDSSTVTISDCEGYNRFDDFELSGIGASRDELNEISSELRSGVIL